MKKFLISLFTIISLAFPAYAQTDSLDIKSMDFYPLNYNNPKKYTLAGIKISGVKFLDTKILTLLTGLYEGQRISLPGDEISKAIENLWKQKFFTDIKVIVEKIEGEEVYLIFHLEERPRLANIAIRGLSKKQSKKLREEISAQTNQIVNENMIKKTENEVLKYYNEKGFLNTKVEVIYEMLNNGKNQARLIVQVEKGPRVKINDINFVGNQSFSDAKLRRLFKENRRKNIFRFWKKSKFNEEDYKDELLQVLNFYNSQGFRDAVIIKDTIYRFDDNSINIDITISEGKKYYFRNIAWIGNNKYSVDTLRKILNIQKGDIYDYSTLERNLRAHPAGIDISTLYMDQGHLFFNADPVEVLVDGDSIDLEIRINEGPQATVNKVTITGNTKTSDYVIMREIRTKPGDKFSKTDIQRSIRELAALGYFDPEKLNVVPTPNPYTGTVDIEYQVEEKSSDQIELSGGFGQGFVVGTLGLNLTNFSTKKLMNRREWNPIPSGDGQRVSLRAQSNGSFFQSYNASFTEPWFGGKKPNSLSVSMYHSIQSNGVRRQDVTPTRQRQALNITGLTIGFGKRNKIPDDFFTTNIMLNYQYYNVQNYPGIIAFRDGFSNNINLRWILQRNSMDQPIYPRSGSSFLFSVQATPPWSRFSDKNYAEATAQEKYRWIEYHKWKFEGAWYTKLVGNLVLAAQAKMGYMGNYNKDIGDAPFERFYLGGAGLIGFNIDGRELIAFRGYEDNSVTPEGGATVFNRFTVELRYPISLNPQATVYVHSFMEAGNSWSSLRAYNPFGLLRSAGTGVRIFLPMFGLLGIDWGYGFDENPFRPGTNRGRFHFFIGQQF